MSIHLVSLSLAAEIEEGGLEGAVDGDSGAHLVDE